MKLTEEQKQARNKIAEIARGLCQQRIRFHNRGDRLPNYRTFVLFDGTEVTEGGWLIGRKWMTAKFMNKIVGEWVRKSYATRVDALYEKGLLPVQYVETLKQQGMLEYTAGDGQCGGCQWFAALDADYGLCFNQDSPNEGRITFEHGGCIYHSFIQKLVGEKLCKGRTG